MTKTETLRRLLGEVERLRLSLDITQAYEDYSLWNPMGWSITVAASSSERKQAIRDLVGETLERLPLLLDVVEAAGDVLPYLPDMEPTAGARAASSHVRAAWALRQALAALEGGE